MVQEIEGPVRTCIGCRKSDSTSALFRVVLEVHTRSTPSPNGDSESFARVIVDHKQVLPGRGAWLHSNTKCSELATKRRAFPRAFRTQGEIETVSVDEYVNAGYGQVVKI